MNVLMLCGEIPFPPHGGSRRRVYEFIRKLSTRHRVTLLAYQYEPDEEESVQALRSLCRVEVVSWQEPPELLRMRSGNPLAARLAYGRALLLDVDPFLAQYFRLAPMRDRMRALVAYERFDLVHVEDTAMMGLLPAELGVPVVLSIENVESWREERAHRAPLGDKIDLLKLRQYEARAFRRADISCPTSALEAEQVRKLAPKARVRPVPNGVDTRDFSPGGPPSPDPVVVFTGTLSYAPNARGITWFVREVFPLIQDQIPEVSLTIVGREPPDEILALSTGQVRVLGDVPDVTAYLHRAWVSVVPIRDGGGTRLKILEAMACALPVVATSIGAEGLGMTHEANILIADDAAAFGRETVRLLRDAGLRRSLGCAGRRRVEQEYDWRLITAELEQVYRDATGKH